MNDKVLKASDIKQRFPDGSIETVWGDYYRINKQGQLELALASLPEFTVRSVKPKAELSTWTSSDLRNSDKIKKERRAHLIVQELKDARKQAGKAMIIGASMIPVAKGTLLTYKAVSPFVKKFFSNPYVQTGLTIDGARNLFTDNGVLKTYRHFRDGEYGKGALSLTGDVLDATGAYGLGNRVYHIGLQVFIPTNRAAHAYTTIAPASYESPFKRAYPWIKSMLTGKYPDVEHPTWSGTINEVSEYIPSDVKNSTKIATTARDDAWRIYNGLPQKHGTYIKNPDGSYSYDLDRISKLSEGTFKPILKPYGPSINGYDYITGAGGGLTKHVDHIIASEPDRGIDYGVLEIEDLWDLQPFSRSDDRIYKKVNDSFGNFVRANANKIYTKLFYPLYNSSFGYNYLGGRFLNKLRYEFDPHIIKPDGKIDTWFKNFEVGKISGGKPFLMHTEIPYTEQTRIGSTVNIDGTEVPDIRLTTSLGFNNARLIHPEIMEYNTYGLKGINKILNNKLEPLELEDFSKYIIKNNKQ